MDNSSERIQKALDSLLYLPHLKEQQNDSLPVSSPLGGGGGGGRGRPWDRGDLFRRLGTFKSSTWFCKPEAVGPVECARRGWTNTALDLLTCEVPCAAAAAAAACLITYLVAFRPHRGCVCRASGCKKQQQCKLLALHRTPPLPYAPH